MSRLALYFASGESLYAGAVLLALCAVTSPLLQRKWLLRMRNAVAWAALALIVMACPPFPFMVDVIFILAFLLWFVAANRTQAARLQWGSSLLLTIFLCVLTAVEFSHREMPRINGNESDRLVVIGDSISSGIDPRVPAWPTFLRQICGVGVKNLAKPGAQVAEAVLMAGNVTDADYVVIIEIGGNDLLAGVASEQYEKGLEALLSKLKATNRTILMFELPLLPNRIAYGQIQRHVSAKYGVWLIPKRYLASVIGDAKATTDGLHLSAYGAQRMAAMIANVLSPVVKCRQ